MNSLERLKEAAEHPGSYINGPDIALALKVIEAAGGVVALSKLVTERSPDTRIPNNLADEFYAYCVCGSACISFTTLHAIADALAALTEEKL